MMPKYGYGFACLSTGLAVYTIATTSIVGIEPTEWGIVTKLPLSFWIGLLSLFIFMYVGRKSTFCNAISLLLIMLYLFIIPTLVVENPRYPSAYYPFSEGLSVANEGRLIVDPEHAVARYHDVPLFLYLVSVITILTKIPSLWLLKYFPIVHIFVIGLFVYLILRIKFSVQWALQGVTFFLASFWVGLYYFSPQSIAFVIFLMIFLLVSKIFFSENSNDDGRVFTSLVLISFFALTLTHVLTTALVVSAIATMYVLHVKIEKKRVLIGILSCMLFISIWLACLDFFSSSFLEHAAMKTAGLFSNIEAFITSQTARVHFSGSIYQATTLGFRLLSAFIVVTITVFALVKNRRSIRQRMYWLAWLVAFCFIMAASSYGAEMIIRVYMFALIPLTYLSVELLASKSKMLPVILMALILLNIPANHGGFSVELVPTSTLSGASFYTRNSVGKATYFTSSNIWRILLYYDPILIMNRKFLILEKSPRSVSTDFIGEAVENSMYTIDSDPTRNLLYFYYGSNVLTKFELDKMVNRIYDNEGFQVFENG